jgi:hypothetical protein
MEIFLFLLLTAFILALAVGGFSFIWYGTTLLKDKDFFSTFFGIFLITIGVFFVFATTGIIAILLTVGLKF